MEKKTNKQIDSLINGLRKLDNYMWKSQSGLFCWASLAAQRSRIRLLMQEMQVRFQGQEDPLKEKMATPVSCQENPLDRAARQATAHGVAKSDTNEQLNTFYHTMNKNKLKID